MWVCGHVAPCQTRNKHTDVNRLGPIFEELPKENAVGFYKFYHQEKKKKAPSTCPFNSGSVALDTKNSTFYKAL